MEFNPQADEFVAVNEAQVFLRGSREFAALGRKSGGADKHSGFPLGQESVQLAQVLGRHGRIFVVLDLHFQARAGSPYRIVVRNNVHAAVSAFFDGDGRDEVSHRAQQGGDKILEFIRIHLLDESHDSIASARFLPLPPNVIIAGCVLRLNVVGGGLGVARQFVLLGAIPFRVFFEREPNDIVVPTLLQLLFSLLRQRPNPALLAEQSGPGEPDAPETEAS